MTFLILPSENGHSQWSPSSFPVGLAIPSEVCSSSKWGYSLLVRSLPLLSEDVLSQWGFFSLSVMMYILNEIPPPSQWEWMLSIRSIPPSQWGHLFQVRSLPFSVRMNAPSKVCVPTLLSEDICSKWGLYRFSVSRYAKVSHPSQWECTFPVWFLPLISAEWVPSEVSPPFQWGCKFSVRFLILLSEDVCSQWGPTPSLPGENVPPTFVPSPFSVRTCIPIEVPPPSLFQWDIMFPVMSLPLLSGFAFPVRSLPLVCEDVLSGWGPYPFSVPNVTSSEPHCKKLVVPCHPWQFNDMSPKRVQFKPH